MQLWRAWSALSVPPLRVYSGHWAAFKASFAEMDCRALSEILTRYEEHQELKVAEM